MEHRPDLLPGLVLYGPQAKNVCFLMFLKDVKKKKKKNGKNR